MNEKSALPWIIAAGVGALALGTAVQTHLTIPYEDLFKSAGDRFKIDPNLLAAIARVESNFNAKAIGPVNTNGTRDYGIMQINERTAQQYGYDPASLVDNVGDSLTVAARYIVDVEHALGSALTHATLVSAYNEGVGNVLSRGIINAAYVSSVTYHWTLYTLGRLFA